MMYIDDVNNSSYGSCIFSRLSFFSQRDVYVKISSITESWEIKNYLFNPKFLACKL